MFQFRRFPSYTYFIQYMIPYGGFPHSEISGSQFICNSPKLIAAYHVLHRLLMPRHSPCALFSLTFRRSSPHMFRIHPVSFRFQAECSDMGDFSSQIKTRFAGLLICFGERFFIASLSVNQIDSPIGSLISWIMQAHVFRNLPFRLAKIAFYPKKINLSFTVAFS